MQTDFEALSYYANYVCILTDRIEYLANGAYISIFLANVANSSAVINMINIAFSCFGYQLYIRTWSNNTTK